MLSQWGVSSGGASDTMFAWSDILHGEAEGFSEGLFHLEICFPVVIIHSFSAWQDLSEIPSST